MKNRRVKLLLVCATVLLLFAITPVARGDGDANNPIKMHWPQLPDLNDTSMDVSMLVPLGDDFNCTDTNAISDIHIWGSFYDDKLPMLGPGGLTFQLSIYSNITADGPGSFGSIVGWGRNLDPGGNWGGQASPPAGNNFVAIAAGGFHSLALRSDGSIVGWGFNGNGQATPPDGNNFVAIAAGGYHSLALRSDGSVVGWGFNGNGQATPPDGNNFVAIAAGLYYSLALRSDGSILGWGDNSSGQATPPTGNNFVAISAGWYHGLGLRSVGSIVGWGWNASGQATPPDGNDFVAIAAGGYHSLALRSDGSMVGWGWQEGGVTPPSGNNFVAIAAGGYHSLALYKWSRPGEVLWSKTFLPGEYTVKQLRKEVWQGWYDPNTGIYEPNNHKLTFQYNFYIDSNEAFVQYEGNTYWLVVEDITLGSSRDYKFGWKTTRFNLRWNDDAVFWRSQPPGWYPMKYPPTHQYDSNTLDLAFAITSMWTCSDLGDAPDSTNSWLNEPMTAYPAGGPPGVTANFPTVYWAGSPPYGPKHWYVLRTYLGWSNTREPEADGGDDEDRINNILPPADLPDLDGADDGVVFPLSLPYCAGTQFDYIVTITDLLDPNIFPLLYVNVWFDWNRDGDWNDTLICDPNAPAREWAVQNQEVTNTGPGVYILTTPPFLPWHPTVPPPPIWMRITLSCTKWDPNWGAGGAGPAGGYQVGETEDYYLLPDETDPNRFRPRGGLRADFNRDRVVNLADLGILLDNWLISDYNVTPVAPSDANLVAYYQFNGDFNDSSGNGNNGEPNGASIINDPNRGLVASFDGVDDYVDCGNNVSLNITGQVTLAMWVNTNDSGNGQYNPYVAKGDQSYAIQHKNNNNIEFFIYDGGAWYTVWYPVDSSFNGVWRHLAGTYNGNQLRLYVDGELVDTSNYVGSIASSTYNLNIGRSAQITNRFYDGLLDDVRIYSRALSQGEVGWLAGRSTPYTQPLYLLLTPQNPAIDLNSDGRINFYDFAFLANEWLVEQPLWP